MIKEKLMVPRGEFVIICHINEALSSVSKNRCVCHGLGRPPGGDPGAEAAVAVSLLDAVTAAASIYQIPAS